jgi:hypothetical protein
MRKIKLLVTLTLFLFQNLQVQRVLLRLLPELEKNTSFQMMEILCVESCYNIHLFHKLEILEKMGGYCLLLQVGNEDARVFRFTRNGAYIHSRYLKLGKNTKYFSMFYIANTQGCIQIEQTFVDGQGKDVWCRSKTQITNLAFYETPSTMNTIDTPSCYFLCAKKLRLFTGWDCGDDRAHQVLNAKFMCVD